MILGGDTGEGEPTGGPFVLDLKTHTWSVLRCDGELPRGTVGHCSAAIDSRVYVFGGFDPHTDHRAPTQARQIPGCTLTWSNPMPCRLRNSILTICTAQAYQNVLSVLTFDPLGQQLPRWEVLVSDAQEGGRGGDQVPARRDHSLTAVHAGAPVVSSGRQNSRPSAPLILFGGWHRLLKDITLGVCRLLPRPLRSKAPGLGCSTHLREAAQLLRALRQHVTRTVGMAQGRSVCAFERTGGTSSHAAMTCISGSAPKWRQHGCRSRPPRVRRGPHRARGAATRPPRAVARSTSTAAATALART